MNKQNIMKKFLSENVDFEALQKEKNNSWVKDSTPLEFAHNGIVAKYLTYDLVKKAIEKAEYKFPENDRTWLASINATKELILENIC